jgi:hypothetical protein
MGDATARAERDLSDGAVVTARGSSGAAIQLDAKQSEGTHVRNMVYAIRDDLFVVVHRARPPTDAEWTDYLDSWKPLDMSAMRTLVFTDGGGPNPAQRKAANAALAGKSSLTAVVSSSALVRGIVTALGWFNPKIKAFGPEDAEHAFAYLGIRTPEETTRTWLLVERLKTKLGDASLKSIVSRRAA